MLRTRRRLIAALLAGVAVWAAITAIRPAEPATAAALVTTRPVQGGAVLAGADVEVRQVPVAALPQEYLGQLEQAVGRALTVALPAGAVLLPSSVVSREALAAPGKAVLPITLAATAAGLIEVGDRIDLIGSTQDASATLASAVRVVAVLRSESDGGLVPSQGSGPIILVELNPATLPKVAEAASRGPLGFGFR